MRVVIAYLICAAVWGTTWFAIRVSIGTEGYPTFVSAALRFSLAAVILLALLGAGWGRPLPRGRREWMGLVVAGLLNSVGYALVYVGEETVPGGIAAVLYGTQPLILALLVTITGTERVTRWDLLGAFTSLLGIGVIFLDRLEVSAEQAVGIVFILISVIVATVYVFTVKRVGGRVHPVATTAVFLTITAMVLWGVTVVDGWRPLPDPLPLPASLAIVYLAVFGSALTFVTYFWLIKHITLMTAATLVFVVPIIALFVDALWETDVRLGPRSYLGVVITMTGVAVSVWKKSRPKRVQSAVVGPSLENR